MEAVTLKGRKAGFEIQLAAEASLAEIEPALVDLLKRLAVDTPTGDIEFVVETGNRLLTSEQEAKIREIFAGFSRFTVSRIRSAVVVAATLRQQLASQSVHRVGGVLRSGQEESYAGDILFLGTLHNGAILRATGSIFVLGSAQGVLIAGAEGDQEAVIVGDISRTGQIRIADTIEIIEENNYGPQTTSFINDLHILEHGEIQQLTELRPKLFRQMEESTWEMR